MKKTTTKSIISFLIVLAMFVTMTTSTAFAASSSYCESRASINYLTITAPSGLNVRYDSNTSSRVVGAIPCGEVVHVKAYRGNWAQIDTGIYDGRWICTNYTVYTRYKERHGWVKTNSGCALALRTGPSTSFSAITSIPYGTRVNECYTTGSWSKVYYQSRGRWYYGWVSIKYIEWIPITSR